jgi:Mg-chelatase subunit ChlD
MESIPKNFICPITQEVMKDPVVGPDGMTYEREAITNWLKKHKASPITRQPMDVLQLVPNRALKAMIEEIVNGKPHVESIPLADNPQLIALDLQLSAVKINDRKGHLQISITPPEEGPRQPSAFICCIDISGSMNEEVENTHFSRLDLVKHSVKTISQMMSDNDYLGLIAFNDSATTIMQFTRMNDLGKKYAQQSIDGLEAEGQTNIWDALRSAIHIISTNHGCRCLNTCVLLFTDGEPNVNPPRDIMRSLNNLKKTVSLAFSIHTFGYGYQLDSELLFDIATAGFGSYNYIPDSSIAWHYICQFCEQCSGNSSKERLPGV